VSDEHIDTDESPRMKALTARVDDHARSLQQKSDQIRQLQDELRELRVLLEKRGQRF
jgi:TolA-binding protein